MGTCHNAPSGWCDNPECITKGCKKEELVPSKELIHRVCAFLSAEAETASGQAHSCKQCDLSVASPYGPGTPCCVLRAQELIELVQPDGVAPIAKLTVHDGLVVRSGLYAPGLPDGEHDVFPVPVSQSGEWKPFLGASHEALEPALTDDDLRKRWRAAGGSFYGPNVEHGDMEESKLLPFLRDLYGARQPPCTECNNTGVIFAEGGGEFECYLCQRVRMLPLSEENKLKARAAIKKLAHEPCP